MSHGQARAALERMKARATGQVPVRIYWCRNHKAYHVTSKPNRKE